MFNKSELQNQQRVMNKKLRKENMKRKKAKEERNEGCKKNTHEKREDGIG